MNEEETSLRKELRRFRSLATSLTLSVRQDAVFCHDPAFQAEAIIKGYSYWLPSRLLVRTLLATGELELKDKVCPDCGYLFTREEQYKEKIEKAERFLKEEFEPVEITHGVTMPLVKTWLEMLERYMVEEGYRLPRWDRPQWLKEIEGTRESEG